MKTPLQEPNAECPQPECSDPPGLGDGSNGQGRLLAIERVLRRQRRNVDETQVKAEEESIFAKDIL